MVLGTRLVSDSALSTGDGDPWCPDCFPWKTSYGVPSRPRIFEGSQKKEVSSRVRLFPQTPTTTGLVIK